MDPPNKKSSQSRQFSLQALALGWLWVASPGLSPSLAPTSSAFLRNDTAKGGLPSAFICPNPSTLRSPVTEDGQSKAGLQPDFQVCSPSGVPPALTRSLVWSAPSPP